MFGRIDRVGVAVEDIDSAIGLDRQDFEMAFAHRETVHSGGVEAVLLDVGDGHVELLRPLGLERRAASSSPQGPGLHHVAYAVEEIDATLKRLADAGLELIDSEPWPASAGGVALCTRARPAAC